VAAAFFEITEKRKWADQPIFLFRFSPPRAALPCFAASRAFTSAAQFASADGCCAANAFAMRLWTKSNGVPSRRAIASPRSPRDAALDEIERRSEPARDRVA
jgi:hypothetical protein